MYYGQKKNLNYQVDIASIHSFEDDEKRNEILSKYGMIIVDEVHHVAAKTFEQVIKSSTAKRIYGLTATPKRSDGNEKIIFKTIGDIVYEHKEKLKRKHPGNNNIETKIRQMLQQLRDMGFIKFVNRGIYKKLWIDKEKTRGE